MTRFAEVESDVCRVQLLFGNAALDAAQEMLGVALDEQLDGARPSFFLKAKGFNKYICER